MKLKRRIYQLAKIANIDPKVALSMLREAGYNFNNINDQVAISSMERIQKYLSLNGPFKGPKVIGDSKEVINFSVSELPTRAETKSVPRKAGEKPRAPIHYLDSKHVIRIHYALVDLFVEENDPISPSGLKDDALLESACHRAQTSLGDTEKYKTVLSKAAAFFHSLILNHPFYNGNKRTALVSLVVFLDLNRLRVEASDDDLFEFVIGSAERRVRSGDESSSDKEVQGIEEWLRSHSIRVDDQPRTMRVKDFLHAIEAAGGRYRLAGNSNTWVVWGPNGDSISFGRSVTELTGSVVKRYIQKLGLSQGITGIHFDEFSEGLNPEQKLIRRFRMVLRRLSHT